ncbi:MAG: glycosyltransferase family 39 protein [Candidatus Hydrogenedentes bacterium]|nr:glycosyltransferase family 39 protein [Candidatus Hydrogenedentota bacterium]
MLAKCALLVAALGAFFLAGSRNIEGNPPLWWDEGWTLSVARNWLEQGHYGLFLSGQPCPPTLAAHFPVVAATAFSFHLFGVGIWQGRIVGVILTAVALALIFELTRRLYSRKVAFATLAILLLCPAEWYIHPLHMGRQVIGETHLIAWTLAGYLFFLLFPRRPYLYMPLAVVSWAVALLTKDQILPFWLASVGAPVALLSLKRQWRRVGVIVVVSIASLLVWRLLNIGRHALLTSHITQSAPILGLTDVSAMVFVPSIRRAALRFSVYSMFPALAGLLFALGKFVRSEAKGTPFDHPAAVRLMLFALTASWMFWFIAASIGWPRYAFPIVFLAAPFVAFMLFDLTKGLNASASGKALLAMIRTKTFDSGVLGVITAIILIVLMCKKGVADYSHFSESISDRSAESVATFLNNETPQDSEIETYESELLFLLQRRYHFPPPQLNVDFIRRNWHDPNAPLQYDTSTITAEYLVVGKFGKEVYAPLTESGRYQLLRAFGPYEVYRRAR